MSMLLARLVACSWLVILALGCSREPAQKIAAEPAARLAMRAVADFRSTNIEAIHDYSFPELWVDDSENKMRQLAAARPWATAGPVNVIGFNKTLTSEGWEWARVIVEVPFPEERALFTIDERGIDEELRVFRVNIQFVPISELPANDFTFAGIRPIHFIFLVAAVAALGVTLIALIVWFRARNIRRRWLWLPAIILGPGQIVFNWRTRAIDFRVFYLTPLSVGFSRVGDYAPWVLRIGLPLGAVAFLMKRLQDRVVSGSGSSTRLSKTPP